MAVITREAVQLFDDCRGVVERFPAGGSPDLREWTIINMLIGEMILLRNGRATAELAERIKARITAAVADGEVFALLAVIADRKIGANDLKA
jgi:hypothetical protein